LIGLELQKDFGSRGPRREVWVWIEQRDGSPARASWVLLAEGERIGRRLGVEVSACVLGSEVEHLAREAFQYGADSVYLVDDPTLSVFRVEPYVAALADLVRRYRPEVFLCGLTARGRDLAGALAAELETGSTADCVALAVDPDQRQVRHTRLAFNDTIMATVVCPDRRPQIATVRSSAFAAHRSSDRRGGSIVRGKAIMAETDIHTQVVDFILDAMPMNIAEARVIVAGGRGTRGPHGFALLTELAQVLGGAVAATRQAVDNGWVPYEHQVGLTGRTVQPDLYIACGISGAPQHLAGMQMSRIIVAINTDRRAPIFKVATYGIVGDLFQVVPALTEQLRRRFNRTEHD
jgi:electron transfer flavoprotein alpha subunit